MSHKRAGFTLIEMMAAVVIFALLAALVAPQVGSLTSRNLWLDAEGLAEHAELARQRAVVTGVSHRLLLDVENASYQLQWSPGDDPEEAEPEPPEPVALVSLAAPDRNERAFVPVPGKLGDAVLLDDETSLSGVETPDGWRESGEIAVTFELDGTATGATIHLSDTNDRDLAVEVRPLADRVDIRNAE